MAKINKIKVLIADDDGQLSRRLADFISDHGFEVRIATGGNDAKAQMLNWQPRLVLADMMLPEANALDLLDFSREEPRLKHRQVHVLVLSGHNSESNVRLALSRGAKDYLVKPFRVEDVLRRLVFHCRTYRHLTDLTRQEYSSVDEASLMLHLTDLVLRQAITGDSIPNILFNLTRMVALKVAGVRCSVIHVLDQTTGVVVVSNDDKGATGIELDLNKYPEVVNVINTGVMIAIENIENSPELKLIKGQLRDIMFNSMIVCPISRFQKPFGVISLRMPAEKVQISDNEMRFVEIVSHVVSLVLSNENFKDIDQFWQLGRRNTPVVPIARAAKK
ncbi:MAG: response regulator [Bdellovibrionales bacterium]